MKIAETTAALSGAARLQLASFSNAALEVGIIVRRCVPISKGLLLRDIVTTSGRSVSLKHVCQHATARSRSGSLFEGVYGGAAVLHNTVVVVIHQPMK